ncbi:MAG: hypothetical protein JNJ83_24580 [Verrucomicrobiaceae bacterium]|nr:hypothetical protein [Verrucomicrobiaceae bacterium]
MQNTHLVAAWRKVEVSASQGGIGPGGGTVQKKLTGFVYFPPKNEVMLHDDDGNLIQDGRWVYGWDAENRLISMETMSSAVAAGVERMRLKFTYDWQGRRVRKLVQKAASATSTTWTLVRDFPGVRCFLLQSSSV